MKRTILLFMLSFIQTLLFAQWLEYRKMLPLYYDNGEMLSPLSIDTLIHMNRIFVIDGTIPNSEFGFISGGIFILEYKDSKRDTIDFWAHPGDIEMYLSDYEYVMKQENIETIYMQFSYGETCINKKGGYKSYDYEIPVEAMFSKYAYYMIIYIYNTDKKENKKYYVPLPGKTYNYQLDYPAGGVRIGVQKKWTKKQKDCWKYTDYHRKKEQKKSGVQILDSNPLFYRQIEQTVLRQNCISYLLPKNSARQFGQKMYNGNAIKDFQVNLNQQMDDYSSFVKFMEQAFEWELMSYYFYPYYWGAEKDWAELYKFDSDDAIFRNFMQAGMARVIVTVKPGFEDTVAHYIATGQIWNGGATPVIGDPLYLSIVDELKEQEYEVDGSWETMLPTNLIALQKSGVAIDAEGLPVLDGDDAIKGSNTELGGGE